MDQPKELEWTRMFAFDLPAVRPATIPHECCDACKEAREIKCVCACKGKNHGAALKKDVKPLDEFNADQTLRLDPLVSRELIYIG